MEAAAAAASGQRRRVASGFAGMNVREVEVHFGAKPSGCPTGATAQ